LVILYRAIVGLLFVCLLGVPGAAGDWHAEFDELCSKVEVLDDMGIEEIEALVQRADKLLPLIEASDDTKKKVYIFRLKKCRAMFDYTMRLKQ
jgi:hypothetical protein